MRRATPAFLIGLILGAAAGSLCQRAVFRRALRGGADRHRAALERLTRELGLSETQKTAVSAILDSKHAEVDKVKAETFARIERIRKAADAELAKALSPEQAAKLAAMHRARPLHLEWEAPPSPPPGAPTPPAD